MEFTKYMHLERFGTAEVEGIEIGVAHVFPKIDGTNGSIWLSDDGEVVAGSRNRDLSKGDDNAGFYAWVKEQSSIKQYLAKNPEHILYGEWLVPHSLKTYRDEPHPPSRQLQRQAVHHRRPHMAFHAGVQLGSGVLRRICRRGDEPRQ
ncbi:hypothetical protein JQW57_18560 [Sulfitobacter pseudonitzschiae]|nr:hypothetical protein [Pseudosulfitobacter pseudonitzschiae]